MAEITERLEVGGKVFIPTVNTTFDQDMYLMSLMTNSGITELSKTFKEDMPLSEAGQKVVAAAYDSGKLFLILGAGMVEEGKRWSKEDSVKNAQFLANLESAEDKSKLHGIMATVIIGFFLTALASLKTSENSGRRSESEQSNRGLSTSEVLPTKPSSPESTAGLAVTGFLTDDALATSDSGTIPSES